ncbi:MAG: peptide chain release factor 1 [Tissierellia bacterium]|nr:peptide chain release factor 1 [Tissierellia bacterium]
MIDKLVSIEERYEELGRQVIDPEIISNSEKWQKLMIEHASIEDIVFKYREYIKVREELEGAQEMLREKLDDDMNELVKEEIKDLEEAFAEIEEDIRVLLIPTDPNDHKNVIVEIRGGAGGDEAALFAGVLYRMYSRYAERNRWKTEIMSTNEIGIGGFKEVIFMIKGKGAYSRLKYESGVHRVQRIPETESSGRIHTSTATVAVLPEAEDVDIDVQDHELKIDTYRASGAGGQHVNTTDSAIRITHLPTGLVVSCQDEKSQTKNKAQAMKILKTRLYDKMLSDQAEEIAEERRIQVGTGDRSERIRTYNFPQGRVTDHRINVTLHKLGSFVDGDLDEMIDSLITSDQAKKLGSK